MDRATILSDLCKIFQDVFEDASLKINENTNADDIEQWDSLANIMLLVAIESKFNVKFNLDEMEKIRDVRDIINVIKK